MQIKLIPDSPTKSICSDATDVPASPTQREYDYWFQRCTLMDRGWSPPKMAHNKWRRFSYIPVSIICVLLLLIVLMPVLDQATERALQRLNYQRKCDSPGYLVETIPEGLVFNDTNVKNFDTFWTWMDLINNAEKSIEIASLYWTLRGSDVNSTDPSDFKGEKLLKALQQKGKKGVKIRIAQNEENSDTKWLMHEAAAEVRTVNFTRLLGGGVLHTKMIIVDKLYVYIGSANMDWRSLAQVKEMGIVVYGCSCLATDALKIFEAYWTLGLNDSAIPVPWPDNYSTSFNAETPIELSMSRFYNSKVFKTFLSSSPPPFNGKGRTNDIDALVGVIQQAEKFVHIAVMDYIPLMIYTPKRIYWPVIDDALKSAAIDRKVSVKLLISKWNHSRTQEDEFLRSLAILDNVYKGVSIEVRRFIVPSNSSEDLIPFARVNHNKYMVTDKTAFIGTSNWAGDYFTDTAGVSFVMHDPEEDGEEIDYPTIRAQLESVFQRDWNSQYAHPFIF
ncbi:5'-3' exonuclease PLD3-like [Anthonomus grandis grandis]|uniref:5'-3' exonuclease PLD3-like n=1 Tax=Anthonomus grandis grandis TaxID=2921223 RepID=UPI002166248B|nr:5'-3' exonuclease PLD3-like [Anthonomus grandis grandis]XP_050292727.1 5'-3' exonuclease PLD3-like [Anthonomus grandis grandis]